VLLSTYDSRGGVEPLVASGVAGTIRTDGATVAATLPLDPPGRELVP
jgi:hypothetical protein